MIQEPTLSAVAYSELVTRRLEVRGSVLRTVSLTNRLSGAEYVQTGDLEFELTLHDGTCHHTLSSRDCQCQSLEEHDGHVIAGCAAFFAQHTLRVQVHYGPGAGGVLMKWLEVLPIDAPGITLTRVTLERLTLHGLEGAQPFPRWKERYGNGEDNVHSGKPQNTAETPTRFTTGEASRSVLRALEGEGGLFFFSASLLGDEGFCAGDLVLSEQTFAPLSDGFTTSRAITGAYSGPVELGFKRYSEYLLNHWCCVREKKLDVSWSTWLITLSSGKGLFGSYDSAFLLEYLELIREAGFYDTLHLDLGWEADYPLHVSAEKFPNGMREVSEKAREYGLGMTYWVNPFSSIYWRSRLEEERPEWHVPGQKSGKVDATAICVMTEHFDTVKQRFRELVSDLNARLIYWDGLDWNIPACASSNHGHHSDEELKVKAIHRLAELCDIVHTGRQGAMLINFSLPMNNHRLSVIDQEQISDTYSYPTIEAELIHRQQLYQMTWEHPYKAIWGSWYGVNWHDAGEDNLRRPLHELIHAEMSMIGNGLAQAGGGFDLKQAPPEFIAFLRRLFAFRRRFLRFFDVYQHVLGFPDGQSVDGEGHIIEGRGFIILVNPTRESKTIQLPLDEPELELNTSRLHALSDWSNLEEGRSLGSFRVSEAPDLTLGPLEVKYIGANI